MTIHTNGNGGSLEVHTLGKKRPAVGDLVATSASGAFYEVTGISGRGQSALVEVTSLETGLDNAFRVWELRVVAKRDHAAVRAFCAPIREASERVRAERAQAHAEVPQTTVRTDYRTPAPIERSHPSTTRYAIKAIDLTEGQVIRDRYGRVLVARGVHHGLSGVQFTLTGEGAAVDLSLAYDVRDGGYVVTYLYLGLDYQPGMGQDGRCLTCDGRDCEQGRCKRPWIADRA